MPYKEVSYEKDGMSVFSLRDINDYGRPELYGIEVYLVIDDPTESCPYVLSYQDEQDRRGSLRPIHRYSMEKRFQLLLRKFLGGNFSRVDNDDLYLTIALELDYDRDKVWNSARDILKKNGWSRYYDQIPSILDQIGYEYKIRCSSTFMIDEILNDFKKLTHAFLFGDFGKRKYMLNYRYLALKLMERHGVVFEYRIPLLKTERKLPEFEDLWRVLVKALD